MTDAPSIDLATARRFLACLAGDEPVHFQTFNDRKDEKTSGDDVLAKHACLPFAKAERWLVTYNGRHAGCHATVNRTDGKGREESNVIALRALFVDIDGHEMPASWPLEPSILVRRSADRWHAYWLLGPGEPVSRFTIAQTVLAGFYLGDLKISDPCRVMRIPGFLHWKGDPLPVELLRAEGERRYTIDQVVQAHVVDWASLPPPYQRKAARLGLWAMPEAPAAPARPVAAPADDDEAWQVEQYRKWAGTIETAEGSANPNGGRDNSAFKIACEGHGRGLPRDVIEAVTLDYLQRARVANPESDCRRLVASACSRPREGHRPVRRAPMQRQSGGGSGASRPPPDQPPADGPPPEDPPPAGDGDDTPQGPFDGLDVDLLRSENRWSIGVGGVAPIEWDGRREAYVVKVAKRLGSLPLWPARLGRDVATGRMHLEVGWITPAGETRHQWLTEEAVKHGLALLDLPEGPIAGGRWQRAAEWLTEARHAIRRQQADVTSRMGWCGINGSRRWVWPGTGEAAEAIYIGDPLPAHGTLDGWLDGLRHLLELPEQQAYTALVCVALSAAAPWARLINGKRNPVLGLLARSSSGKGSVMGWALALWCEAESLTLPASSSVKGLQDRAVQYPDLPIFCDEMQQLLDQGQFGQAQASDAIYFLANGQRRVTSSKAQVSVGGEARHGVGFYAAEAPILPGLNAGVQYRVIELRGDPCPGPETARKLRQAAQHTGVLAEAISRRVQALSVTEWIETLRQSSHELARAHDGLEGGDGDVLALVQRGCDVLGQVCGLDLPTDSLVAWLAGQIAEQRSSRLDRETVCLQQVLDWLLNLNWTYDEALGGGMTTEEYRTEIALQGHLVAWSEWGERENDRTRRRQSLSCDPTHRELAQIFDRFGGERRVLPAWAARGWIERQGRNLKVRRRGFGRVVRFTRAALIEHVGEEDLAGETGSAHAPAAAGDP